MRVLDRDPLTEVCIAIVYHHCVEDGRAQGRTLKDLAYTGKDGGTAPGGSTRPHMSIRRHCRSASTHCNCSVLNFGRKPQSTSTAISVHTRDRFSMSRTELRAQAAVYHEESGYEEKQKKGR